MHRIATALLTLFIGSSLLIAKDLKYTLVPHFFDEKPDGKLLGPCHGGIVIDKAGNFYVTTDTERGIVVFSPEGKYMKAVGPHHVHGLEIREENGTEYIYGARPDFHEVVKLKLDGEKVWSIGTPVEANIYTNVEAKIPVDTSSTNNAKAAPAKKPKQKTFNPCALTVAPDGSIFVADGYGANYVLKFDKNRKFVKAFGGPGDVEGTFKTCHGIAIDLRGEKPLLFVCNRNIGRVEHWDLDGNFVSTIQKDLRMPAAVHIRGDYAVVPELQGRVTVLDREGKIVAQVGDNPNEKHRANNPLPPDQWVEGIFNSPHGASLDKDLNIVVTEWSTFGRLSKFALEK
jgi:DNA-binding beta-propeller fold protein YncE